ncbi:Hypothetical predicted protein [Cloeon dipterum]|uniref:60S ribosomal protein L37 n=1 Tax=Cloeon dipterum TaxID=197152 RepID=A0A8S1CCZ7_9INSE|nr:Hypothetical predicted protein [Cloeon dipterum]
MTKGTSSFGKRRNKTHTLCRRCGRSAYHIQKKTCAQCGYPSKRLRHFNWSVKAQRRKTTGTGRMRFLKIVRRRFRNGFREGGKPAPRKAVASTPSFSRPKLKGSCTMDSLFFTSLQDDHLSLQQMMDDDLKRDMDIDDCINFDMTLPLDDSLDFANLINRDNDFNYDLWINSDGASNSQFPPVADSEAAIRMVNPHTISSMSPSNIVPKVEPIEDVLNSEPIVLKTESEMDTSPPQQITFSTTTKQLPARANIPSKGISLVCSNTNTPFTFVKTNTFNTITSEGLAALRCPPRPNKSMQPNPEEKIYPKPAYSYSCLIALALKNSASGSLPVSEIYNFMCEHFPYFKTAPNGWKNSVRHNLSLNKCFEKIEKPSGNGSQRKGCLWAMNPSKMSKMDEEVQKWSRKDPQAIRRAMVIPENLEQLERGEMKRDIPSGDDTEEDDDEESPSSVSALNEQPFTPPAVEDGDEIDPLDTSMKHENDFVDISYLDDLDDNDIPEFDLDVNEGLYKEMEEGEKHSAAITETSIVPNQTALTATKIQGNYIYKATQISRPIATAPISSYVCKPNANGTTIRQRTSGCCLDTGQFIARAQTTEKMEEDRSGPSSAFFGANLEDLSMTQLEELLQKNRQLQIEIRLIMNNLVSKMNDCISTKKNLINQILESELPVSTRIDVSPSAKFSSILISSSWKPSYPYFLDTDDFPPPLNQVDHIMKKNNFLTISSLRTCYRWHQSQMKMLDKAVSEDALYSLQTGLLQKKKILVQALDDKMTLQKMLNNMDIINEDIENQLREKFESGRTIEQLEKAIKETDEEINRVAGEPLQKVLHDPDHEFNWAKIRDILFHDSRSESEIRAMWKLCLQKTRSRKPWTSKETEMILELAAKHNYQNWIQIAKELGRKRSAYQVFIHFQTEANRTRNKWTEPEDNAVIQAVKKLRMGNYIPFSLVANHVPGRSSSQIAQRWRCFLDPTIYRGTFTAKEDMLLYICRSLKKMSYGEISENYFMRSTEQLRKRFHALRSSEAFEEMLNKRGFVIDPNRSIHSARKVQMVFSHQNGISLSQSSASMEISEKRARKCYAKRRIEEKHKKYYLSEENLGNGRKLLKVEERCIGGRPNKVMSKEEIEIAMYFFSKYRSGRIGRYSAIVNKNVEPVARAVKHYCEKLDARVDFAASSGIFAETPQMALVLEKLQDLSISNKPIYSIIAPQYSTLVGYMCILLEVAKLQKHTLASRESLLSFREKCEKAAIFMNSRGPSSAASAKGTCQNVHLVPSDSARPTVSIHLHKDACSGRHCVSNGHHGAVTIMSNVVNVCGNIQELYFIEKGNDYPTFKLNLSRFSPKKPSSGITINCRPELPVATIGCDDAEHISPEEALELWKLRFVALFSVPAIIETFSTPEVYDFKHMEGQPVTKKSGTRKCYYRRKRKFWKYKNRPDEEKAENKELERPEEEAKKPPRKRRSASEMTAHYAQMKKDKPTRSQKNQPNAGQVTSSVDDVEKSSQ